MKVTNYFFGVYLFVLPRTATKHARIISKNYLCYIFFCRFYRKYRHEIAMDTVLLNSCTIPLVVITILRVVYVRKFSQLRSDFV